MTEQKRRTTPTKKKIELKEKAKKCAAQMCDLVVKR